MSKPKKWWIARVYLGRDENGKQLFDWVGRYPTRKERDVAVARRRLELEQLAANEITLPACDEYVDRYLEEYERLITWARALPHTAAPPTPLRIVRGYAAARARLRDAIVTQTGMRAVTHMHTALQAAPRLIVSPHLQPKLDSN